MQEKPRKHKIKLNKRKLSLPPSHTPENARHSFEQQKQQVEGDQDRQKPSRCASSGARTLFIDELLKVWSFDIKQPLKTASTPRFESQAEVKIDDRSELSDGGMTEITSGDHSPNDDLYCDLEHESSGGQSWKYRAPAMGPKSATCNPCNNKTLFLLSVLFCSIVSFSVCLTELLSTC